MLIKGISGGSSAATVDSCSGTTWHAVTKILPGSIGRIKCGSIEIAVDEGTIPTTLTAEDGRTANVDVPAPNAITFHFDTAEITTPSDNPDSLSVIPVIEGVEQPTLTLPPGGSLVLSEEDTTGPVIEAQISGTEGSNGWYTTHVHLSWDVSDAESAISSQNGCDPQDIISDTAGQTFTCEATSVGGTSSESVTIKRDATAPQITAINGDIADGASFYFGDVPSEPTTCEATDATSGLDGSSNCQIEGYSTEVGEHTLVARVRDNAGNEATREITYIVNPWEIKGFYSPVDMNDVVNTVKSGQTVPVKFEVFAGGEEKTSTGSDVIRSFTQGKISCSSVSDEPTDVIEVTTTGGTILRYSDGTYVQTWKTPPKAAGICYEVTLATADGSEINAYFKLT